MTTPTTEQLRALADVDLSEAIEAACATVNRLYCAGMDTSDVDATVDALIAEHERRAAA